MKLALNSAPDKQLPTYAIDFESFYSNSVGITTHGTYHYLRHPDVDIYLVSIVGPDISYCGSPKKAPWNKIKGSRIITHNMSFDWECCVRLHELGIIPANWSIGDYNCTANLSAYFKSNRSLAKASENLLQVTVNKDPRAYMKNKHWETDVPEEKKAEIIQYALVDSQRCLELWDKLSADWSLKEKALSQHTILMCHRGVGVNLDLADEGIRILEAVRFKAESEIPWSMSGDDATLSYPSFCKACREEGIEPPASLAATNDEYITWEHRYGNKYPWAKAMGTLRSSNALLVKTKTMRDRIKPDGRFSYGLKYTGGHTLRFSGDQRFNPQNLPREPKFGFDLRRCLIPPAGKQFGISDYSQIEPRVLATLVGDFEFIELCKKMSPYEAHARATMNWTGGDLKKENKAIYALSKARILSLGYGAGWEKFIGMMINYGIDPYEIFVTPPSEEDEKRFIDFLGYCKKLAKVSEYQRLDQATKNVWVGSYCQVRDFRAANPKITAMWKKLDNLVKTSKGDTLEIHLPGGGSIAYFKVATFNGNWTGLDEINGKTRKNIYGGLLTENVVQHVARQIFTNGVLAVEAAGYPVVLHVHDEIVAEVPTDFDPEIMTKLMCVAPDWMPTIPLAVETHLKPHYVK